MTFGDNTDKFDDVILMKLHAKAKNMLVENYFKGYCESDEHKQYVMGQSEIGVYTFFANITWQTLSLSATLNYIVASSAKS